MIYSQTSSYAIRALAFMATQPLNELQGIQKIAEACFIPPSYLAKIFRALARAGFVNSHRGAGGGFTLRQNPKQIRLLEVIETTDDRRKSPLSHCVMGLNVCSDKAPCLIHKEWSQMTARIRAKLKKSSIKDLARAMKGRNSSQPMRPLLSKKIKALFDY